MKPAHVVCIGLMLAGTMLLAQANPVPFVNQPLVPMTAAPGGAEFTLTVNGTGFVSASVVNWNGAPLTTTFVTGSKLTAIVPASNIATAGTASVTVVSPPPGGGVSNVEFFDISSPRGADVTFTQLPVYTAAAFVDKPIAADVNGDGKLDLAYVIYDIDNVVVQLGNGDGTFKAPVAYPVGSVPVNLIAADFNGDGKLDLAVVNFKDNTVSILLGNGDGTFQPQKTFATGNNPEPIVAADFNRDGKLDLAIGLGAGVSILLGNGDGTFQSHVDYDTSGTGSLSIAVGDFNGDGNLDLIYPSSEQGFDLEVTFLQGNGDGTFQQPVRYSWPHEEAIWNMITADLNGDDKLDLMAADFAPADGLGGGGIWVWLGNGDGTFQSPVEYAAGRASEDLAVQDFNADDKLDAALANFTDLTFSMLLGNGDGSFQSPIDFPLSPVPTSVVAGDFNGDGKMDLAMAVGWGPSAVIALLQGQFPLASLSPSALTFPQQGVNTTSPPQNVTLTNTETTTLTISGIGFTGANANDFGQTNNCPPSLGVDGSCQISVTFTPLALGSATASLNITDNAPGSPQTVALAGATPPFLSPQSVTFPNQYVGTSGLPQSVTLYNTGTTALTIANVTASPSDFAPLSACGSSVAPGASCSIGVFFDPTTSGTRNGVLTVTDSATDSPQTATLTGTGQDFSMAPSSPSSATVTPGQNAQYTIAVAPLGGFDQTVTLSCAGAPAQSTCSLSPSPAKLSGSGSTPVTVTVTTTGSSAGLTHPGGLTPSKVRFALWLAFAGLPGLVLLGSKLRKPCGLALYRLLLPCMLCVVMMWSACGGSRSSSGSSGGGTPPGSYNLTVTGSFASGSSNLVHSTKLTLVVQ